MSSDDNFKKLIDGIEPLHRSDKDQQLAQDKILRKASRKQNQVNLLEFGFVKIWTILLEFLMLFYVKSKQQQIGIISNEPNWSKK